MTSIKNYNNFKVKCKLEIFDEITDWGFNPIDRNNADKLIISYFNLYNDATLINVYDKDLFTKIQHACRDLSTLDLKTLETFTCMNQFHPSGFRVDLIDFHVEGDKPELTIWCSDFFGKNVKGVEYSTIGELKNALQREECNMRRFCI